MKRILGGLILVVLFAIPAIFGPAWVLLLIALLVVPICMYELFRVAIAPSAMALGFISMASSVPFLILANRGDHRRVLPHHWCHERYPDDHLAVPF